MIDLPNRPWPTGRPADCDDRTSTALWLDAEGIPAELFALIRQAQRAVEHQLSVIGGDELTGR
ncbi:hypothetical protein [Amycolatopsis sp. NPDC003861]